MTLTFSPSSMLFGPAGRLDFVPKFAASGARVGILDLEAATPEAFKDAHRLALAVADLEAAKGSSMRLFVRVNALDTDHFQPDIEAAAAAQVDGIIVPLVEQAADVRRARQAMHDAGIGHLPLMGGVETARGVINASEICDAGLDLVYFGAEDFVTDIQGRRTRSNTECHVARSLVVLAARAAGIHAIDQVVVATSDNDRMREEADEARTMGFSGKLCIHPGQVALANAAFAPSREEVEWANAVIAASLEADARGAGATTVDGEMIDAPIRVRAEQILRVAAAEDGAV